MSSLYNARKLDFYSECMGRQEEFLFSIPNFFEEKTYRVNRIDLPILSPYRLFINIQMLGFVFVVPILYALIYRFRKKHDMMMNGKESDLQPRLRNLLQVFLKRSALTD